uniref:WD_REPEATS_REGION domain-containing protein n=1 Tax=Strongyloides papillosus TaxID=174720 RepID=A0A0N5BPQ1_STREA
MDYYMPEIYWHDKKPITSVDILRANFDHSSDHPVYRLATASMEKQVRLWNFRFDDDSPVNDKASLFVEFIADLSGHNAGVNIVRFSPNGEFIASGDTAGYLFLWKLSTAPVQQNPTGKNDDDLPPNKENWVLFKRPLCMNDDITYLAWSKCSRYLAISSKASEFAIYDVVNSQKVVMLPNYRSFCNGISWDPRGNFIATLSTDRKLDIIQLKNGYKVKSISTVQFPSLSSDLFSTESKWYKIFHDEQLMTFFRGLEYSPCGELLVTTSGVFESEDKLVNGSFVFSRESLVKGRPLIFIPNNRPTIRVSFSPHFYKLRSDCDINYSGLPYRILFAILDKDSVKFYDSQSDLPFAYVDQIHYDFLYDLSWSPDGEVVVVSSNEGFNSFIKFKKGTLGEVLKETPEFVSNPELFMLKVSQKKKKEAKENDEKKKQEVKVPKAKTPKAKKNKNGDKNSSEDGDGSQNNDSTNNRESVPPPSQTLLKFFQRSKMSDTKSSDSEEKTTSSTEGDVPIVLISD